MIKAIIYDMDDLMINSHPAHQKAWRKILSRFNHRSSDLPEKLSAGFIGKRIIDISKEMIDYLKIDIGLDEFYKARMEIFLELAPDNIEAMPGLFKSLKLFKNNGLKIALASSGTEQYIKLVLNKFKINDCFSAIVSGDDVTKGKPDPEPYLVACKKLELDPENCLVLEDATNGIESAKTAGCKCIAIINPYTLPQDHSQADLILNSLNNLSLEMINSLK